MKAFDLTRSHLDVSDLFGATGTLIQKRQQLIINSVYFAANVCQDSTVVRSVHGGLTHFSHQAWRLSKSLMKETRVETPS